MAGKSLASLEDHHQNWFHQIFSGLFGGNDGWMRGNHDRRTKQKASCKSGSRYYWWCSESVSSLMPPRSIKQQRPCC